jgi:hypothetical protein
VADEWMGGDCSQATFFTTNPIWMGMDVTEFKIRYSEEGKWQCKRISNKKASGSERIDIGTLQNRCFALGTVFLHMSKSVGGLILPDS